MSGNRAKTILSQINDRYFGAIVGGRARFYEDRLPLEPMDEKAFRTLLKTLRIPKEDGGFSEAFPRWIEWGQRRFYPRGFILDPNVEERGGDAYNLWQGYGVTPARGDVEPFLQHIDEVVEPAARSYLLDWMCWVLRNPADVAQVAVWAAAE